MYYQIDLNTNKKEVLNFDIFRILLKNNIAGYNRINDKKIDYSGILKEFKKKQNYTFTINMYKFIKTI